MRNIKITSFLLMLLASFVAKAQDWPNLKRFHLSNEKLEDSSGNHVKVVYMGDSITDFWLGASPTFFTQNDYVDRGISGQTSPQMLLRFRADVLDLKPKAVVLLCGINDIAGNTGPSTLEMIEDNIKSMADLAKANKVKMILCSLLPANRFSWKPELHPADSVIELNNWIKAYAKTEHLPYVDYYPAMVDDQKGLKQEYSKDGVHPNKAGYAVMEKLAQAVIKKTI